MGTFEVDLCGSGADYGNYVRQWILSKRLGGIRTVAGDDQWWPSGDFRRLVHEHAHIVRVETEVGDLCQCGCRDRGKVGRCRERRGGGSRCGGDGEMGEMGEMEYSEKA